LSTVSESHACGVGQWTSLYQLKPYQLLYSRREISETGGRSSDEC
jgi:hypothetical protein